MPIGRLSSITRNGETIEYSYDRYDRYDRMTRDSEAKGANQSSTRIPLMTLTKSSASHHRRRAARGIGAPSRCRVRLLRGWGTTGSDSFLIWARDVQSPLDELLESEGPLLHFGRASVCNRGGRKTPGGCGGDLPSALGLRSAQGFGVPKEGSAQMVVGGGRWDAHRRSGD